MHAANVYLNAEQICAWLRATAPGAQLSSDSRAIAAGDVFFAYPGDEIDGRAYIGAAVAKFARGVVVEADGLEWDAEWKLPYLAVSGLKAMAGQIANLFYDRPDQDMFVVAVTGTNGKTSCTQWIAGAISALDETAAVIGTLGVGIFQRGEHEEFTVTGYTTPDAVLLQRKLAKLRSASVTTLAIEASSIGLHQARLAGLHIDVAVFTNLTRDHLDYHGDMDAYEAAKVSLFNWPNLHTAVVNLDDAAGVRIVQHLQAQAPLVKIIGYTVGNATDHTSSLASGLQILHARDVRTSHAGTVFHLEGGGKVNNVRTQLIGQFNVSNVLAVIAVLLARGASWSIALDAVEELTAVPGRMQQLGGHDAPLVVIDYAHTPDALEKTILSLRQVATERHGKLWCVFGCGGERDPGKRPIMGGLAQLADQVVVTSDNPRGEDAAAIMAQIEAGMQAETPHQAIEDRAAAILYAVRHATRQDVVLLAGKGHETYQEIKGRRLPFLDADHAALALATRATMKGLSK